MIITLYRILTFSFFILIFSSGFSFAQDDENKTWTLEECINYALKNNLSIQRGELDVRDTEIQLTQSKADIYPNLSMGGGYSNRWGRSIDPTTNLFETQRIQSLGVQGNSGITVYGGFQLRNRIKQNRINMEVSSYDLESAENDVMLSVTNAFLNVILDYELLDNAEIQLSTTKAQLETVRKQVRVGALPYSNELDLVAQVESNEVQVINAENNLRISQLRLKQLLLIPASEPFEIDIPEIDVENLAPVSESSDEVFLVAENIMPSVKSADLFVESTELGERIARGGMEPRLSLSADIFTNYSSLANRKRFVADPNGEIQVVPVQIGYVINPLDNTRIPVLRDEEIPEGEFKDSYPISAQLEDNISYSVSLGLSIPIFNGLSSRGNHQRAKIQAERAEIIAEETRQNLRQNVELAYSDAIAASKTYNASIKQVASLEEAFRAAQKSYNLGAINNYDYQVASNNLFRAKSDLLQAKYNYIFTLKVIDFYLGKPLSLDY